MGYIVGSKMLNYISYLISKSDLYCKKDSDFTPNAFVFVLFLSVDNYVNFQGNLIVPFAVKVT